MSKENNLPQFTIKQLLEAGVHFGHKTMRRNTKMIPYLYGARNGLSIINLQQTAQLLHQSLKIVKEIAKNNGRILFIATKKQAADVVAESAKRCGQYYVNQRWLGGMLTNWKTVSRSIKTLKNIEAQLENDEVGLNKKERLMLERKRAKLEGVLGGIKNMGGYPDLIFVIDTHREALAIAEAKNLKLPIMAILDSNCNPSGITYPIPGNDDSVKSIRLYCRLISDAILAGMKENMALAGIDLSKLEEGLSMDEILKGSQQNNQKNDRKFDKSKDKHKSEGSKHKAAAEVVETEETSEEEEESEEKKEVKVSKSKKVFVVEKDDKTASKKDGKAKIAKSTEGLAKKMAPKKDGVKSEKKPLAKVAGKTETKTTKKK